MANITDNITYVNFSKLQEFNETLPTIGINDFETVQNDIFSIFVTYPQLQWFLSIVIFIGLFMIIRKIQFIDLTDAQIVILCSFVVMAMNTLLLLMDIFNIVQPFQLFTLIWLITLIAVISNKRR